MPKLVASCRTTVMDGMEVKNITSEKVLDARKGVVEFLLINHPLDCPVCDQAGECDLQNLSYEHGSESTRAPLSVSYVGQQRRQPHERCAECDAGQWLLYESLGLDGDASKWHDLRKWLERNSICFSNYDTCCMIGRQTSPPQPSMTFLRDETFFSLSSTCI